jgi:Clp amino terminal domain, pathogenicity island component
VSQVRNLILTNSDLSRHTCHVALPDLDELIAEVDRTCATATTTRQENADWVELLKTASEVAGRLQALGDDLIEEFVEHCRHSGRSWGEIGAALGVTRQAAQQRYLAPFREYGPEETSDELRTAYVSMKTVAVLHRNNYIGTEHVLYGLLSDNNSATAALAALRVPPGQLRDKVEKRLSLGASLAAERIAWTPYARRAAALAKDIATEDGWAQVRCDHFLGGLVQLGRGVAADLLAATGINEDDLRGQMKKPKSAVPPATRRHADHKRSTT